MASRGGLLNTNALRIHAAATLLAASALIGAVQVAHAQAYPTRPVRFIVPFPPGAGLDITARAIVPRLSEALGKPVVVDNRAGAGGIVGLELAARATPDGHTVVMASASHVIQAILAKARFDFFRDLQPATEIISSPYLLVITPSLPVKSVKELVAYAKANPGKLNYASSGPGTLQQLSMELFKTNVGIDAVEVPYKGVAPAFIDLAAGRVQVMLSSLASLAPHVRAKTISALAVTARERAPTLPDLPTMIESGVPGFIVEQWQGTFVPAGTPASNVEKLQREIARALESPELANFFANDGAKIVAAPPVEFKAKITRERAMWTKVIAQAGLKSE
jgi:tripartite-type tricarboxylate transporter receptor subunit TctC